MRHYNYIFTGAGLSALITVYRMAVSGKFTGKTILMIDSDLKKSNDRTWCFWEEPNGEFDSIVSKKWKSAWFTSAVDNIHSGTNHYFKRELDLTPYQYKMIRGIDFYNHVFEVISKQSNITFLNAEVIDYSDDGSAVSVKTANEKFTCDSIFNSILNPELTSSQKEYPVLQQHFVGWFIKTNTAIFNPDIATFMDFSVEQKGNTRFMYVLPTSQNEALIEYTLFSEDVLPIYEYETAIARYIKDLGISDFEITGKERGSIPMTAYKFWKHNTKNILNIGSAGGWTKASTGYTFKSTIKKSAVLVQFLQRESDLTKFYKRDKFWFYDLLLLDILAAKNHLGSSIFSALFKKRDHIGEQHEAKPALILKFLDEETSFSEDLSVILKCPKRLFISALLKRILQSRVQESKT